MLSYSLSFASKFLSYHPPLSVACEIISYETISFGLFEIQSKHIVNYKLCYLTHFRCGYNQNFLKQHTQQHVLVKMYLTWQRYLRCFKQQNLNEDQSNLVKVPYKCMIVHNIAQNCTILSTLQYCAMQRSVCT